MSPNAVFNSIRGRRIKLVMSFIKENIPILQIYLILKKASVKKIKAIFIPYNETQRIVKIY